MPNFEHAKKRAKQILHMHRDRHWPVATQIRGFVPGFEGLTDREILDREFKLAQAQHLVARQWGFADWHALKSTAVDASDEEAARHRDEATQASRMTGIQAFLMVSDIDVACDYYAGILGFSTRFKYGEPPFYAQIERDEVQFSLRAVDAPFLEQVRDYRRRDELPNAMLAVTGIRRLYDQALEAGAKIFKPLTTESYGMRQFVIEDPDGNMLVFGEDSGAR